MYGKLFEDGKMGNFQDILTEYTNKDGSFSIKKSRYGSFLRDILFKTGSNFCSIYP